MKVNSYGRQNELLVTKLTVVNSRGLLAKAMHLIDLGSIPVRFTQVSDGIMSTQPSKCMILKASSKRLLGDI